MRIKSISFTASQIFNLLGISRERLLAFFDIHLVLSPPLKRAHRLLGPFPLYELPVRSVHFVAFQLLTLAVAVLPYSPVIIFPSLEIADGSSARGKSVAEIGEDERGWRVLLEKRFDFLPEQKLRLILVRSQCLL